MSHIPPRMPKRGADFVSRRVYPAARPVSRRLLIVAEAAELIAAGVVFAACMVALVWAFALMEAVSS